MKLRDALRLKQSPVVLGVFHNTDELFRACAVLTDFGYPRELARLSRVETIMPADSTGIFKSFSRYVTPTNIIIALLALAATTVGAVVLAEMPLSAYGRLVEIIATLALWVLFFSAGSLACVLIGFLIWTWLEPLLANNTVSGFGSTTGKLFNGKVTLRIKARTSVDAEEIAQAWTEIGGRVIEPAKPALAERT